MVLEYLAYTLYPKEWTNFGQRLMQMQPVSDAPAEYRHDETYSVQAPPSNTGDLEASVLRNSCTFILRSSTPAVCQTIGSSDHADMPLHSPPPSAATGVGGRVRGSAGREGGGRAARAD
jgi:hypothetical protein